MGEVKPGSLKAWLLLPRFHFIPLTVILVSLGTSIAAYEGFFNLGYFALAMIGSILVHITVNVINDYYDYVNGIDLSTPRTPFSGGSGVLTRDLLKPRQAFWVATLSLLMAMVIGIFFVFERGWLLFPLLLVAGFSAYFYNVCLSKWWVGELFAGLNFGPIMVLGSYYVQTGRYSWEALFASLAPGVLTANLLFLNEFPDREADERGGRRHIVIALGRERARFLYVALIIVAYLLIVIGVVAGIMPWVTLIGLGTMVFGWKAAKGALNDYNDVSRLVPALGANVVTILGTQALLAVGYVIAGWRNS
jgi:1,4-dihydroxy-2-naphthoate octaprenyltransferase